jgi:excisionase family DNA binding protein
MSTDWLSVEDIANELGVPADRVRAWIRNKQLRAFRFGRDYRIKRSDYDKFVEESATRPEGDRFKED